MGIALVAMNAIGASFASLAENRKPLLVSAVV
jgi:hypothetical protein